MKKYFFTFLLIILYPCFMLSCASVSNSLKVDEASFPIEKFGEDRFVQDNFSHSPIYQVQSGDVFDLVLNVEVKQSNIFKLSIQDLIEIRFPEMPELNQEQRIRSDGKISLPYLGDVKVIDLAPSEVHELLIERYADIIKNPELYIVVKESAVKVWELKESLSSPGAGQSKLIIVRNDGYSTFPVIGEVKAVGKSIAELSKELNRKFKAVYEDIRIDLLLHQSVASKIYVLGSVNNPGFYSITTPITIIEALALAGGFTDEAEPSTVVAMRRDGNKILRKTINSSAILAADKNAVHTLISNNDLIYVGKDNLSKTGDVINKIARIFLFRGFSVGAGYDINND